MDGERMKHYKYCIVPRCRSSTIKTPNKIFFSVPKGKVIRKKWCTAIKRDEKKNKKLAFTSSLYCCEDHFTLKDDMENYLELQLTGGVKQYRLKPGVLPHVFDCQRQKQTTSERSLPKKKKIAEAVSEALAHVEALNEEENENTTVPDVISIGVQNRVELLMELQKKIKRSCSWNGCKNSNHSGVPFHRFPLNKAKCDAWVQAAQNEKLKGFPAAYLHKTFYICSDHFQDWCFMNPSKKRLVHNALPASPKPVPPPRVFLETSEASTSGARTKYMEEFHVLHELPSALPLDVVITPLPSHTLRLETPTKQLNKTYHLQKIKIEEVEEEILPSESPTVNPVDTTTPTISGDLNPVVNSSESQPVKKKPKVTFCPIISKVVPQYNESQKEDDEELELYLKLLAKKLKSYKGLERRQIMHEIDGLFLRKPPCPPSNTPQFLMASSEHSASSSHSDVI